MYTKRNTYNSPNSLLLDRMCMHQKSRSILFFSLLLLRTYIQCSDDEKKIEHHFATDNK